MTGEHWPTLDETEAEDRAAGRLDEAKIAKHRRRMRDAQHAYQLAEIRKSMGLRQADVAARMKVSQRRVSAVEHGDLTRTSLGTVATYVAALGGQVEITVKIGNLRLVIGLMHADAPAALAELTLASVSEDRPADQEHYPVELGLPAAGRQAHEPCEAG